MQRFLSLTLASLLCLTFSAAVTHAGDDKKSSEVSIKELKKAMEGKKVTIIDVNGTDSFKSAHIPGAIDFEANSEKLEKVLPKDKDALVVAYCGGPQCGAYKSAAKAATALGYKNVKHLPAGISGWKDAGEKTDKAG